MARYIDADLIPYVESENGILDDFAYRYDINEIPTADVVPKSEVAKIFEELYNSVASKIPPHIRPTCLDDFGFDDGFRNGKTDALLDVLVIIAELKKKYTGGDTNVCKIDT